MKTTTDLPDHIDEAVENGMAPWTELEWQDFHVKVFRDIYPVSDGHLLFVPQYSTPTLVNECFNDALEVGMKKVAKGEWEAFNIGMNWGKAAGQTVAWPHIHLIPRKTGDCEDPVGGVRGVIPGMANYQTMKSTNPMNLAAVYPTTVAQ